MAKSKKKVKVSKISKVPKYELAGATPGTGVDPATGLPIKPQVPWGMVGHFAGAGVDAFGQDDPTARGYIGTKVGSSALRMAGTGAQIGTMVGGPLGTAIGAGAGAVLGGALGAVQGSKDRKEAKEEQSKNYFAEQQEVYQNRPDFFKMGGMPMMNKIEVEGPELEVSKGKILKDFKGKDKHTSGGYQYNAKPGRVIIRGKDAEKYKSSDQFTRNSMEREHVLSQKVNGQLTEEYKRGGKINFKSTQSYHDWLGYIHATGVAGRTPGHQKVYVRGKKVNVKHEDGGLTIPKYKDGAPTLNSGTSFVQYDENGNPVSGNKFFQAPSNLRQTSVGIPPEIANNPTAMSAIQDGARYNEADMLMLAQEFPNTPQPRPQQPTQVQPQVSTYKGIFGDTGIPDYNPSQADQTPLQTGLSPLEGDFSDPKINIGSPTFKQKPSTPPDWQQIGVNAATWAPAAYNAFMAFQKPVKEAPIYNPHETEALNTLRNRKIDMDPIRRDIYSQARVAAQPLGENQGSYLSRRTQLSANTQKALTDAQLKAQDINNQYSADYARGLDAFGQQRRQANAQARATDLGVLQNQAQYLPKALEETSFLAQKPYREQQYLDAAREVNKYADLVADLQTGRKTKEQAEKEALERGRVGRPRYSSSTGSLYI